jgi:Immunity protein 8
VITPNIRAFHSPDVDDLEGYRPPGDEFALLVQMLSGPDGGQGEEAFDVQVVTPAWLEQRYASDGLVSGDHLLIVFDYDWPRIEAHLRKRVAACQGDDWSQVAAKIGRFAHWEFEDYVE